MTNSRKRAAIRTDVEQRAWYAYSNDRRVNPYSPEDKRHALFAKKLASIEWQSAEFDHLCEAYGTDQSTWERRIWPDPGPVLPISELPLPEPKYFR